MSVQRRDAANGNMTVVCTVQACPEAKVMWLKNNNLIDDESYTLRKTDTENILVIVNPRVGSAGDNYTCIASNSLGEDRGTIRFPGDLMFTLMNISLKSTVYVCLFL